MTPDCCSLGMEIYSQNGDCKAKSEVYLADQDLRVKNSARSLADFSSSTLPSYNAKERNKSPVIHESYTEYTFPLVRKQPEKLARKSFLRSSEHILATFHGLVFLIEGAQWHVFKSENLPIYLVRVSVKNVKYPFRILVIDNETDNHVRVVDFIVNYRTKTSIKGNAVCWQDQETFGAKFSTKSQAFQFYDTISRMASTLKKGRQLESEHLDKMTNLEIHLPNSEMKSYPFLKNDKLQDALKYVCHKEKLPFSDYYFHHMERADDSLDMMLRVGDLRTDKIRLVSKREMRESSSDVIEKVSMPGSRRKNGVFSLFRRRFSRKRKDSPQYSSAPSIIQYTDNVYLVDRQAGNQISNEIPTPDTNTPTIPENSTTLHNPARATKSDTTFNKPSPSTLPTRHVKRRAPQPPKLIIPQRGASVTNSEHSLDGKKTKRRAPSPPKHAATAVNSSSPGGTKPPIPSKPPLLTSPPSQSQALGASINVEKMSPFPVFIAPPPPESTPPPIDECDTPVGPIDLDDGSVEIPVQISSVIDETTSLDKKSLDTKSLDSKSLDIKSEDSKTSENQENKAKVASEEVEKDVEVKVETILNEKSEKEDKEEEKSMEKIEENDVFQTEMKKKKEPGDYIEKIEVVEEDLSLEKENISKRKEENKSSKLDENENSVIQENLKNISPEQLQALLMQTSGQPNPVNLQNQQLFAMQQNQQMLSNILLQQMLQQQMRAPNVMTGVLPVSPVPLVNNPGMIPPAGVIPGMQPPLNGGAYPMWSQQKQQVPPLSVQQPASIPPSDLKQPEETKPLISSSSTSTKGLSNIEEEKPAPPVKEEELVNRPLFKKMLAQVSQGKFQGIPKVVSPDSNPTSPVSPAAKVSKVPTSYVLSAEKNVPQAKPTEDKLAPMNLNETGKKSSYVESAIGRQKADIVGKNNVVTTESTAPKNIDSVSSSSKSSENVETKNALMENNKELLNTTTSSSNHVRNILTNTTMGISAKTIDQTTVKYTTQPDIVHKQTSPPSSSNMTGGTFTVSSGVEHVAINNNHQIDHNKSASVANDAYQNSASVKTSNPSGSSVILPDHNRPQSIPKPHIPPVEKHNTSSKIAPPTLPKPPTPTQPPNVKVVEYPAVKVAAEKSISKSSLPTSQAVRNTLIIEEPDLGTHIFSRTIAPRLSSRPSESVTGVKQNGEYRTNNNLKTSDRTDGPPEVAKKPLHFSESKPTVAAKPTYDIRESKTLPSKKKKPKHIQISLSLTPEERMKIHQSSGR